MSKTIKEFLSDYTEFQRIIDEYNTSFQYCLGQMVSKEGIDRQQLLAKLQTIEISDRQQKLLLQQKVKHQLNELRRLLQIVDAQERQISERRFRLFKAERTSYGNSYVNSDDLQHSRQDINQQVANAVQSIQKITQSKMPRSLAAVCGFFNREFRKDTYRQIVEDRQKLEAMLTAAERDFQIASMTLQREIEQASAQKVTELQAEKQQLEVSRSSEKASFMTQLKGLLLDGLERIFSTDTAYRSAHKHISNYLSAYSGQDNQNLSSADGLMIGIVNQTISAMDDGTLDRYLSTILQDGIYSNRSILLSVTLERYLGKAICVNYYSEYNDRLYDLFSNYALQMMNLFSDIGITTYMVDCTNMGSKYADFTAFESDDDNKRINIIRTNDELKKVINELSDYIIETNSSYLRSDFADVCAYNNASVIKRELKVLFVSNITEISSMDLLDKLTSIVRNGSRSGVMVFIGISTDECRVSGLTSQNRVTAVNLLLELCDKIYMSSDGDLSFGNGLPQFLAAPEINSSLKQNIMMTSVQSKGSLTIVPLLDHLPASQDFFTYDCSENVIIPVGVDAQGNEYIINLNKEAAYMLIGGNPSCGKSSLVHTIILQCITRYSPENLELYVADLKDGSEFDIYVQKGIKSVKVVLDDSEADIATSFLTYIKANVEARLQKFGELATLAGQIVRNIEQFYTVNNEQHLVPHIPRMLLIIDEFQSLYNSSRATGEITNWLVRMCRTVGIYIIMASQRVQADSTSVSNSFGSQTKEYFIYRAMFKLPYSGAKEIMSEHCSDTNRENPAIRKAQTLKSGQIVINPNMGATEEDNQLVQCYYPNNDTIAAICEQVVAAQGSEDGIILNSESAVSAFLNTAAPDTIVLGESNRLYYDDCNKNNDDFIDNRIVALRNNVKRLLVCGNDTRVHASVLLSVAAYLMKESRNARISILSSNANYEKLMLNNEFNAAIHLTASVDDFLSYAKEQVSKNNTFLSVIFNPYEYEQLHKDDYSRATESVEQIMGLLQSPLVFSLILCENMKKLKDSCTYLDQDIPCRVISVGNPTSIRAAMTMDAGEKITESPFNTVRPNIIKAYYYNKTTDKLGRFRLPLPEQICGTVDFSGMTASPTPTPVLGYSGLTGNGEEVV